MNETLKAVIVEVTGGNVRNHHIDLRGAFGLFPTDALGGGNADLAGKPLTLLIGAETVTTDIDRRKSTFRERSAIRSFFEKEPVLEGDLILIERVEARVYQVSKASKRAFKYHL